MDHLPLSKPQFEERGGIQKCTFMDVKVSKQNIQMNKSAHFFSFDSNTVRILFSIQRNSVVVLISSFPNLSEIQHKRDGKIFFKKHKK